MPNLFNVVLSVITAIITVTYHIYSCKSVYLITVTCQIYLIYNIICSIYMNTEWTWRTKWTWCQIFVFLSYEVVWWCCCCMPLKNSSIYMVLYGGFDFWNTLGFILNFSCYNSTTLVFLFLATYYKQLNQQKKGINSLIPSCVVSP
jgi:hypothetical protein